MIKSSIIAIVCLIAFHFVGTLVLWVSKQKPIKDVFADVFIRILIGFVCTASLYAIIQTHANTVSWGFFVVYLMYLFAKRQVWLSSEFIPFKNYFVVSKESLCCWASLFLCVLGFVLWQGFYFYNSPFNNEPHFDYTYYAVVGDEMARRGIESNNVLRDVLLQVNMAPTPYHYVELWCTSMISSIFCINSTESIFVIVFALLSSLFVLGLISIARQYKKSYTMYAIALLSILYAPLVYFDYTKGFNMLEVLKLDEIFTSLVNTKTMIAALFFTFSVLLYRYGENYFLISLLLLPVINIVLAPSVFVAVGCLFLYKAIKKENEAMWLLTETIAMGICIVLFYYLQSESDSLGNFSIENIKENICDYSSVIKSVVKMLIFIIIFHLPMILGGYFFYKKDRISAKHIIKGNGVLLLVTGLLLFAGFIVAQITKGVRDHTQFYALPAEIVPIIYTIIILEFLTLANKKWERGLIVFFCAMFAIFSCNYQTFQHLHPRPFSNDVNFLADISASTKNADSKVVATTEIAFLYPYPMCAHISDIQLKTIYIGDKNQYNPIPSTFTKYADSCGKDLPLDSLQRKFIEDYNIKFVYTKKENLLEKVDTIFYEGNTGKKFVVRY